jgi:hypothetical protein
MKNDLGPDSQINPLVADGPVKQLTPQEAHTCLRRQQWGSAQVYSPRLQPKASGFCINP